MTSSLRNSIHRRNHKERSQLAHRARFGLLEKHSDYVKRARDFHSKQDRLTRLRQKAADRNKDEFYFSMQREKTKGGVHMKDRGNVALPTDLVKLLKTQDENYVRTMRSSGRKKIDKLKETLTSLVNLLHPIGDDDLEELDDDEVETLILADIIPPPPSSRKKGKGKAPAHLVFVHDDDRSSSPVDPTGSAVEADASMSVEDLGWDIPDSSAKKNKRTITQETATTVETRTPQLSEETIAHRRRLLKELSARLVRDQYLRYAEREFEMQRQMMGSGRRKKVSGPEKIEGGNEDSGAEDEDTLDARGGKKRKERPKVIGMDVYKPRVYKWRIERKK